ncbi:hypothetical protein GGR55DRAFT_449333 [Xylaria sp. FL0064]|nr:hypothetical protein GGR55DRAFT_449333 [Xylaria sp. FL0064]
MCPARSYSLIVHHPWPVSAQSAPLFFPISPSSSAPLSTFAILSLSSKLLPPHHHYTNLLHNHSLKIIKKHSTPSQTHSSISSALPHLPFPSPSFWFCEASARRSKSQHHTRRLLQAVLQTANLSPNLVVPTHTLPHSITCLPVRFSRQAIITASGDDPILKSLDDNNDDSISVPLHLNTPHIEVFTIHLLFMYQHDNSAVFRHLTPLTRQSLRIPRKPCNPDISSIG